MSEDITVIVGGPANMAPGSMKVPCADCKTDVWLARSGQKFLRENPAIAVCMSCAAKRMKDDETAEVRTPSREAILEDLGITGRN